MGVSSSWLKGFLPVLSLPLAALAVRASAQAAEQPSDTVGGPVITEVIVTAQKRSERLQDVPLSISALAQQQIEQVGASSFEDYAGLVPGLSYNPSLPGNAHLAVRGITTSGLFQVQQGTVGLFIDDLSVVESYASYATPDLRLFDVNRVEVLRGPQGTLFGAGALSGAIRFITNKPDMTALSSAFEGTYLGYDGGDDGYAVNGMVNVPLLEDRLALRLVAYDRRDGGYIDNVSTGRRNTNEFESQGARVALAYQISPGWKATATFIHQYDHSYDAPFIIYGQPEYIYDSYTPFSAKDRLNMGNLVVEGEIGDLGFFSATSYGDKDNHLTTDYTKIVSMLAQRTLPTAVDIPDQSQKFTQEIRLSSAATGRLRWLAGLYYLNEKHHAQNLVQVDELAPVLGTSNFFSAEFRAPYVEIAAFGEMTYKLTQSVEATLGLRGFHNSFKLRGTVSGLLAGGTGLRDVSEEDTDFTPKLGLSWTIRPDLLLYASVSEGYRFGAANLNYPPRFGEIPPTYKSDTLWNYELGLKSSFFDRRLSLIASVYCIDWRDLQIGLKNSAGLNYVTNAGDARSCGAEAEVTASPWRSFEAGVSLSYTDAKLREDVPGLAQNTGAIGAHKGDQMPGSAPFTSAEFVQWHIDAFDGFPLYLRLDHQYVGRSYSDFSKSSALKAGDYNLFNLRLGITHGAYELIGFVDNIGNSDGVINTYPSAALTYAAIPLAPRTIGVTLRAKF